jgi:hypothetical protein
LSLLGAVGRGPWKPYGRRVSRHPRSGRSPTGGLLRAPLLRLSGPRGVAELPPGWSNRRRWLMSSCFPGHSTVWRCWPLHTDAEDGARIEPANGYVGELPLSFARPADFCFYTCPSSQLTYLYRGHSDPRRPHTRVGPRRVAYDAVCRGPNDACSPSRNTPSNLPFPTRKATPNINSIQRRTSSSPTCPTRVRWFPEREMRPVAIRRVVEQQVLLSAHGRRRSLYARQTQGARDRIR